MLNTLSIAGLRKVLGWTIALSALAWLLLSFTAVKLPLPLLIALHMILEITSITLGSITFFIAWHGASQNSGAKIVVISLVALSCAVLDLAHIVFCPGLPIAEMLNNQAWVAFRVAARLVWSIGMLYAVTLPNNGTPYYLPQNNKTLLFATLMIVAGLIGNIIINLGDGLAALSERIGFPIVESLDLTTILCGAIALFIVHRVHSNHTCSRFVKTALLFGMLADLCFYAGNYTEVALNLPGHCFKIASFYYILRAIFLLVIKQPYTQMIHLKEDMERLAANNASLYQESEQQRNMIEDTLAKIGAIISSQLDLKDTLDAIADIGADMMNARQSCIALLRSPSVLQVVATYGINTPPANLPIDNSLATQVLAQKTALYLNDISDRPEIFRPQLIFSRILSILCAPLVHDGAVIGVIEVYSSEKDTFNQRKALLLQALGRYAGAAITSAIKYQEIKMRLSEEKYLYKIAQSMASTIDAETIMERCTTDTMQALDGDVALGFLVRPGNGALSLISSLGITCDAPDLDLKQYPLLAKAAAANKPVVVADEACSFMNAVCMESPVSCAMVLPLTVDSRLLGLIIIGWRKFITPERIDNLSFAGLIAQQIALGLEKVQLYNQVKAMALSDGLTGLANRRNFDMFLKAELRRAISLKRPLSLFMLDIDKFKTYNDTYGHLTGDKLLAQLGQILRQGVRSIDFPARYGGEEFSVILPECGNAEASEIAENLRRTVEHSSFPDNLEGFSARITVSIGVATYDPTFGTTEPDEETVITIADKSLYRAKEQGRNRVISAVILDP